MKKKLVASILGLAAAGAVLSCGTVAHAQGLIYLDSYNTSPAGPNYPLVTFLFHGPISSAHNYTVGFYYSVTPLTMAATSISNQENSTPGGTLATGAGSTAVFGLTPGLFTSVGDVYFNTGLPAGPIYVVVVAYSGASYATSISRGHSAAFILNTAVAPPVPGMGGQPGLMGGFAVIAPEPSTFALAGLGLATLLIYRRRK